MVTENYRRVEERVAAACARCGRPRESVTLIAVSKTQPTEMVRELAEAGVEDFGENKVQELCRKQEELGQPLRWHMIGHLQRNKVKYLMAQPPVLIHSVDSLRLAQEIEKEAAKAGKTIPILIEINIGREESKSGLAEEELPALAAAVAQLPHLRLRGLMAVAPATPNPEDSRPYFRRMRELQQELQRTYPDCTELSMGMTGDFEAAIAEGATMVRVGTAIFGARNYQ